MIPEPHKHRQIRSFVLRSGRMTPAQQNAWDKLWPGYGLEPNTMLDMQSLFGRKAPVVLEIGFGMGDSLVEMACDQPETDFLGIEVHRPGVGRLMNNLDKHQLHNVKVFCHDAVEVIDTCIPKKSLSKVQIFFPDPWHKKKHHKRRIIQKDFVEKLTGLLEKGGQVHLATDWQDYAEHMMDVLMECPGLVNMAGEGQFAEKPDFRPLTKFEKRGKRLGHGVWDLLFKLGD